MQRTALGAATAVLLSGLVAGCGVAAPSSPVSGVASQTIDSIATPADRGPERPSTAPEGHLLATLPDEAGGVGFDGVQIVFDDFYLWGHPVDDVLRAVGKERRDAVAVFRYSNVIEATIGATTVEGIDGETLLTAFADTWNAPAVVHRSARIVGGTRGWELRERRSGWTVMYRRGDAVYLASAPDRATLDAILADMPLPVA